MKAKNHVKCPFCRQVQYPCCKSYLLSSSPLSSRIHASNAQEDIHLTIPNVREIYEKEKQPMFLKVVGLLVTCVCIAIAIYAIVNVTEKN